MGMFFSMANIFMRTDDLMDRIIVFFIASYKSKSVTRIFLAMFQVNDTCKEVSYHMRLYNNVVNVHTI